jgi:NADP-dependent aldehyde dehydrogenase
MAERIAWHASRAEPQVLLNGRIRDSFNTIRDRLTGNGVRLLASESEPTGRCEGFLATPTVLATNVQDFDATFAEETFGTLIVLVRYSGLADVYEALDAVPHSLTATIHHTESDSDLVAEFTQQVRPRVSRIVYNGYPTGVREDGVLETAGPGA